MAIAAYGFVLARLALYRSPLLNGGWESSAALLLLAAAILVVNLAIGGDVFYPLLFNALLFLVMVGLLFLGYLQGRESLINVSLAFFILDVISRYFEFGWTLLDRSLVFIVAGAILLGGGYLLERGRRRVFQRMRDAGGGGSEPPLWRGILGHSGGSNFVVTGPHWRQGVYPACGYHGSARDGAG